MLHKLIIEKEDKRSRIVGDTISIYLEQKDLFEYKRLLAKTWPKTHIKAAMSKGGVA